MKKESGFTLVEVLMALVIISTVLLALGGTTGSFLHIVAAGDRNASALQLADSRIDQIQMDPNYGGLDTTYAGTESGFASLPGFTRTTTIVRIGGLGQATDHKKITVTVQGPGLPHPVSRSITVAAP
ncbi:MAG: hypothetical protein AMS18_10665 [Gemmatimonas sp. SG8_17]|nr:MAG: hypothetical protein AMS18_10665 [Gemmatimonas sp. SG8_17]